MYMKIYRKYSKENALSQQFTFHKGQSMNIQINLRWLSTAVIVLLALILATACAPRSTPPPVDHAGTLAVQLVYEMQTQTAAAPTLTPLPPTDTPTPSFTDTPAVTPTNTIIKKPVTTIFTGCWYGPGPEYQLDSNISKGKRVEIVGIGNIPGWYIIRNPYFHKQCWIEAANLQIDPAMDLSALPVMTPIPQK